MNEPLKTERTEGPFWLFGCYNSRGGACLVEAPTKEEAAKRYYNEGLGMEGQEEDWEGQYEATIEEDFLEEVVAIESYRPLRDGEDLEYGDGEDDDLKQRARDFEDGLAWAPQEIQDTVPNPFVERLWWNDTTKTFCLAGPGFSPRRPTIGNQAASTGYFWSAEPPVDENWKKSNFGEDACGVVLMRKPA